MNKQDILDRICEVFIVNKIEPSCRVEYDDEFGDREAIPMYSKDYNGYGCAVGIFIEDNEYARFLDDLYVPVKHLFVSTLFDFSNKTDHEFYESHTKFVEQFESEDVQEFLISMQEIHDRYAWDEDFGQFCLKLKNIANLNNLEWKW